LLLLTTEEHRRDFIGLLGRSTAGVPDYLVWAIICTVVFCWPAGVVGIFYSLRAKKLATGGDIDAALRASRRAKTACWVSFVIGLVLLAVLLSSVFNGGVKV